MAAAKLFASADFRGGSGVSQIESRQAGCLRPGGVVTGGVATPANRCSARVRLIDSNLAVADLSPQLGSTRLQTITCNSKTRSRLCGFASGRKVDQLKASAQCLNGRVLHLAGRLGTTGAQHEPQPLLLFALKPAAEPKRQTRRKQKRKRQIDWPQSWWPSSSLSSSFAPATLN